MKLLNPQMVIWLVIQLLLVIFTISATNEEGIILFWMTLPFLILNCIGVIIIILGKPKIGSTIFLIGSVLFVPIGLIGVFGARKILNQIKEEKFINTL
ncbi:hypothetical protein [Aquimarina algicola]|uniref:Uncharacterized protein n=1 Tax=Aquimarina algicola TaxID=2589995 RepID=A0A504JB73_9FLAO|nr:hypothetical protein [Aquimarina algicola]TPN85098.1 hypothetical protein FHK87_13790 [Aquimarina algicola]